MASFDVIVLQKTNNFVVLLYENQTFIIMLSIVVRSL